MIGHIKMGRFEYIKWRGLQKDGSEDFLLFYEVDLDNDRYATRMIEIYKDGSVNPVVEEDFEFITEAPVPTIEEINTDPEWHAELISEIEFEKIYVSSHYVDDRKKLYLKIIEDVALEISPEYYPHTMKVGDKIIFQDGSKIVGYIEVLEILNDLLKAE